MNGRYSKRSSCWKSTVHDGHGSKYVSFKQNGDDGLGVYTSVQSYRGSNLQNCITSLEYVRFILKPFP